MPQPILTKRLSLRAYTEADALDLARLICAPEVQCWLPRVPHPYGVDDAFEFIARATSDPWKRAITLNDTFIGGVAVSDQFGYWLVQPFWGQGYATEAGRAILTAWFDQTQDAVVQSGHAFGNAASRNVLKKLGFKDSGTGTTHNAFKGAQVDLQFMTLTRSDWEART
ncbi:MAG: GNAT family N-acetyltransferase [Pseudomonadota bacterium]